MEFVGTSIEGARFTCPSATVLRIAAASNSGQVSIGIEGLWRYRTTNYDLNISGAVGVKDIFAVAVTANAFSNSPVADTDTTDYTFELRSVTTGGTPSSVAAYRKIGEVDWDGAKITGFRQLKGAEDTTLPIQPVAPTPGAPAVLAKGVASQTADILGVQDSAGANLLRVLPDGTISIPNGPVVIDEPGQSALQITDSGGGIRIGGQSAFWRTGSSAFSVGGKLTATGGLDAGSTRITNVANPTGAQDAATQAYVLARIALGAGPTGSAGGVLSGSYPNPGLAGSVAGTGLALASNVLGIDTAVVPRLAVVNNFSKQQLFHPDSDIAALGILRGSDGGTGAYVLGRNAANSTTIWSITNAGLANFVGVDAGSQRVTSVADATAATDAVNRQFGDARFLGIGADAAGVANNTISEVKLTSSVRDAGMINDLSTARNARATVATEETTASSGPINLATVGPTITLSIPNGGAFVALYAECDVKVTGSSSAVFITDGGNELGIGMTAMACSVTSYETRRTCPDNVNGTVGGMGGFIIFFVPNSTGSTFTRAYTMKYGVTSGTPTASYKNRRLMGRIFV